MPGHPERPARIAGLEAALDRYDYFGFERRAAPRATRAQLERVHSPALIDQIAALAERGGGAIDSDTIVQPGSYEAALRSAGGTVALVDALVAGERCGVSALRPPGHHATADRAMGFCLFNSIAVAAAHARAEHDLERVLILDWDIHHGNGTNDIFHADPAVLFCSIHQSPLYPGTGARSDVGEGPGHGFTVNLPVPPGSGDEVFCSLVDDVVVGLVGSWRPELVLISAGFDAHRDEPLALAACEVSADGFATMAGSMRSACAGVGAPLGLVLEGGYSVSALAESMIAVLPTLLGRGAS